MCVEIDLKTMKVSRGKKKVYKVMLKKGRGFVSDFCEFPESKMKHLPSKTPFELRQGYSCFGKKGDAEKWERGWYMKGTTITQYLVPKDSKYAEARKEDWYGFSSAMRAERLIPVK